MSRLHMPTAQVPTLVDEIEALQFILDQKADELEGKDLEICRLEEAMRQMETAMHQMQMRSERAAHLEERVTELNLAFTTELRNQYSQTHGTHGIHGTHGTHRVGGVASGVVGGVVGGYESPVEDGFYAPLAPKGFVRDPHKTYSSWA